MKLLIVESPTKKKTIQKYLGSDFVVAASAGHIRDIANVGDYNLGINIADGSFTPTYSVMDHKENVVSYLKSQAEKCDEVLLASDPDREGEAISWHLSEVLGLDKTKTKRLEFHEITKHAVLNALENPRTINMSTVDAQETRKVLDKIVGYMGSGLVNRDVHAPSMGRVQTAVLKLIDNKEKEINNFQPVLTYKSFLSIKDDKNKEAKLFIIDDENKPVIYSSKEEAELALKSLTNKVTYKDLVKEEKITKSFSPYTTSSLQLDANIKLRFSVKRTTAISKELFYSGLISYPRTDSIRLAPEFINKTKEYIKTKYGEEYVGVAKVQGANGNVQDAHEAIRITSFEDGVFEKEYSVKLKNYKDFKKVYDLIFNRTVQSIMKPRIDNSLCYVFESNGIRLGCFGKENVFLGFSVLDNKEKNEIYKFSEKEYELVSKDTEELSTKPPVRFTEGTLVKKMEDTGIGRPSTYESMISKCHNNGYTKNDKNYIVLTELGQSVIDYCSSHFSTTVSNIAYTAEIEEKLDEVENKQVDKIDCIKYCYDHFMNEYNKIKNNPDAISNETGEICPECGHKLIYKYKGADRFVGCSNYPKCRYVKPDLVGRNCPDCGKPLVYRKSQTGKFIACSGFPDCHYHEYLTKSYYKKK